ncbi:MULTISPECIES: sensor histidine kinase [Haloarcula]|uniref:histidine kinase n=1 Tax=Haloarcula pellucida TaxID=1427151 RepID=A0A830GJ74_9EURY|nr:MULTISPECIES: ATP-binding protein [Halomicroarcula]MBX0347685.1 sensor histidine kinase [Halomicroarcula pellucida]MDS0276382.1 sensor histidine kinase [Halomicroarcula sp. S1AR25-4]GGN89843.1 hypothetical protein GCM10009030_11100 [Halomicroarcula pellucida]
MTGRDDGGRRIGGQNGDSGDVDDRSSDSADARLGDGCSLAIISRRYGGTVAVAFGVVVLLVAATGVASYGIAHQTTESERIGDLRTTATVQAEAVGGWHDALRVRTRTLSNAAALQSDNETRIRRFLRNGPTTDSDSVTAVHYVETAGVRGTVAVSTNESVEGGLLARTGPAWRPVVAAANGDDGDDGVVHSERAYDSSDGPALAFASPVPGRDAVLVVVGTVDERRLSGGSTPLTVFGEAGEAVFASDSDIVPETAPESRMDAVTNGTAVTATRGDAVVAYAPVDGTQWVVATAAERDVFARPTRVVGLTAAAILAVTVLSLGAVGLFLTRWTVGPLTRLTRRVRAMEQGDLDADLSTARRDEVGRLYAAVEGMRDRTREQLRQAHEAREATERSRRELQRQNDRLDQFASTLSHDLRNPLTVARGHANLLSAQFDTLAADGVETDALQRHVHKLEGAHDRIESIIEDVLTLTREGASVEETERVHLGDVARDAWANVDSKDASIVVAESRPIEADRSRLLRAFENLFRNAIDHVGEEATVELGTLSDGFYVADDGPGIPEDAVDDIFEYGHTDSEGGTGLGLSIVKTIAEAHGWRLYVDTTYEDGAMFVFADVFDRDDHGWEASAFEWATTDDD